MHFVIVVVEDDGGGVDVGYYEQTISLS